MEVETMNINQALLVKESLAILDLKGWKYGLVLVTLIAVLVFGSAIKVLILRFIFKFAQKGRPVNVLTAFDQVRI